VDKKGNFFHYSWQKGPNSVAPAGWSQPNWNRFIVESNKPGSSIDDTSTSTSSSSKTDWAKGITRNFGGATFIDFGPDNKYRAIKRDDGGWRIMSRTGFAGSLQPVNTMGDKNSWLKDMLFEKGDSISKPSGTKGSLNSASSDAEKLSAVGDPSTVVASRSQEVAMASSSSGKTTYIINSNMDGGSSNRGNAPGSVPYGISSKDTGTPVFAELSIRSMA